MDIEVRQDRLEDRQLDVERRQHESEKRFEAFIAEVRMYMKNNDATVAELKADAKERKREFRNMMWGGFIAWAVGIVAIVVAIFMSVKG